MSTLIKVLYDPQVDLMAQVPSVEKMDASLGVLKACRWAQGLTEC